MGRESHWAWESWGCHWHGGILEGSRGSNAPQVQVFLQGVWDTHQSPSYLALSYNHRVMESLELEGTFQGPLAQLPAVHRDTTAPSGCPGPDPASLGSLQDRASTTAQGNLLQCLTTLTGGLAPRRGTTSAALWKHYRTP